MEKEIQESARVVRFIHPIFFRDDETVIQFHPKKTEYINIATNCLHLWKPPYVVGLPPRDYV